MGPKEEGGEEGGIRELCRSERRKTGVFGIAAGVRDDEDDG